MIQPLRKIHRGMFLALLVILPVLFVLGLLSRPKRPSFGARIVAVSMPDNKIVSHQKASLGGMKFDAWILENHTEKTGWDLQLVPEASLVAPDVLVYWSESDANAEFPAGAVLLGTFGFAKHYPLTMQEKERGFIVLYSLAQKQPLGSFAIGSTGGKP